MLCRGTSTAVMDRICVIHIYNNAIGGILYA